MHHPKILDKSGCTQARLRAIFTNKDAQTPDGRIKKRFEDRIRSRLDEGVRNSAKNYALMQAVDLAWDSPPIQKETIPLLLWAQGKIKQDTLIDKIKGTPIAGEIIRKQKDGTLKVDYPRFFEISITLVRSYVTRRLSAQTARFANLWPLFRYEPRGTDNVTKLRADALSQRIDVMSDCYNYRHFGTQCQRDMLLYSHSLAFPRSAWDSVTQWRFKETNTGEPSEGTESYVVREGVDFSNPHPNRVYRDMSAPLANINTDTGPSYIGYYDIVRYGTLCDGTYYNLKDIASSEGFIQLIQQTPDFFGYYFDPTVLKMPELSANPTAGNERGAQIGLYSEECKDRGVLLAQHFERVNPKHEGIGDYDCDIWMRMVVAGDGTVVGAEFMPSLPAAYGGINENDNRVANASMAMELLPYQDQLSNLCSQMILTLRTSLVQLWLIDKDSIEKETLEYFENGAKQKEFFIEPKILAYSSTKLKELGITDPSLAFRIITADVKTKLEDIHNAMMRVLNLADRLLILSPNELGQPAPREISAREVQEISTTTSSISTFISDGIDEQRAAIKKICYQSLVCRATTNFRVPVIGRYTKETLKAAGFKTADLDKLKDGQIIPIKTPVMGNIHGLIYDYIFDSRDGAERTVNSQVASILNVLLQNLTANPDVAKAIGRRRLFNITNEIVRLSGAGVDLNLEIEEGEQEAIGDDQLKERVAQLEKLLAELAARAGLPPAPTESPVAPAAAAPAPADNGAAVMAAEPAVAAV